MPKLPKKLPLKGLPKRIEPPPVPKAKPAKRGPYHRQPKFVYVELLDLTPASTGQTVVVRQVRVERIDAADIAQAWATHSGFSTRILDNLTADPDILYHPALRGREQSGKEH